VEYKREGYLLFEQTLKQINETTLKTIFRGITQVHVEKAEGPRRAPLIVSTSHEELESFEVAPTEQPRQPSPGRPAAKQQTVKREGRKIGRNDPCPCGSGKKYKHCCGR